MIRVIGCSLPAHTCLVDMVAKWHGGSESRGLMEQMAGPQKIQGYDVLATLGYGARSTIFAVKDARNHVYALKRVIKEGPEDQRFIDQAIKEHGVASQFSHPALRRSYKVIRQRKLMRLVEVYVLMELVDGLTMEQLETDDLVQMCRLCREVALGLGAMHEMGWVHADIKPNNIMLTDESSVKVIDFGQSCPVGTVKDRIQGTPDYIAPEQVLRRQITPQTDVFNLGATLFWLFTREHVPTLIKKKGPSPGTISPKQSRKAKPPAEINPEIPSALSSLVMQCIEVEPKSRPESMENVASRLQLAIDQLERQREGARNTPIEPARSPGSSPEISPGISPAS